MQTLPPDHVFSNFFSCLSRESLVPGIVFPLFPVVYKRIRVAILMLLKTNGLLRALSQIHSGSPHVIRG